MRVALFVGLLFLACHASAAASPLTAAETADVRHICAGLVGRDFGVKTLQPLKPYAASKKPFYGMFLNCSGGVCVGAVPLRDKSRVVITFQDRPEVPSGVPIRDPQKIYLVELKRGEATIASYGNPPET